MSNETYIMVRPYMLSELTNIYNISPKTIRNWLKRIEHELGERHGRYYSAKQVEIIFKNFGIPYKLERVSNNHHFFN